ncbi:MAG: hypothetical protein IPN79_09385 [Saprospiraceae bacterium]|nr:hypothetical protein [Saprospiraceae bacterium]
MYKYFFVLLGLILFSSCEKENKKGNLDLVFFLEYGGKPLVIFDTFVYPTENYKLKFSRIAAYFSDISIRNADGSNLLLKDVDFLDFSNAHTESKQNKGFTYTLKNVDPGNYSALSLAMGLPTNLNAKEPKDFSAGSLLSSSANYWTAWKSYIFMRTEGNIDFDNDGNMEDTFTLHAGGDEAIVPFSFNHIFVVRENETTTVKIIIDMEKYFNGNKLYDIKNNSSIHSLEHKPAIVTLSDNLKTAVSIR